jgi:hypothetical protein
MKEPKRSRESISIASLRKDPRNLVLDILIASLVVLVGYLSYSLLERHFLHPPVESGRSGGAPGEIIQIDVLNGCGASGMASIFTAYLRARGYDVVETRNYKTFDMEESLVIDRTGNLKNAQKVAYALGVGKENIVQQINPDYYVDVSVVIGKDYTTLEPSH